MNSLPSGPKWPFSKLLALRRLRKRPVEFVMEMAQRYGDLVQFGSWRNPIFFVNHPDMVRELLVSRTEDFVRADSVRKALRIFDGESILVSEGDQWRQQRRLLQQGFRSERLRAYARTAVEHTQEMLRHWPSAGTICVGDDMAGLCMQTLSNVLFGRQAPPDLAASIRTVLDARAAETANAISVGHWRPANFPRKRDQALTYVHTFLDDLIQRRRTGTEKHGDLLGLLIAASRKDVGTAKSQSQVDRQIRDETISMINASLDAMVAAMSWTLYLVSKHTAIQTRLRREIEDRIGKHAGMAAESVELPFAEMVVHESLRLYPPNWVLITRRSTQDSSIGGHRIPKGSWLFVFPYVIHRDCRWFSAPDSFDPDRFAPERFGAVQRSAYIPLGMGPHVCIGKALSTIILTSMMASILQEFRLEILPEQAKMVAQVGVVMSPSNDLRLIAKRHGTC
ncbi:MAG: cytochrome P450 [Thermoguttaceae bacterium]